MGIYKHGITPSSRKAETAQQPLAYFDVEYTDTFGGEANYCWVQRHTIEAPRDISDRALMRRAKALCGLSGMRGRTYWHGDMGEFRPYRGRTYWHGDMGEFRPYRVCTVLFINYRDE